MPRPPGPPDEIKAERARRAGKKATAREISRELRIAVKTVLDFNGGVKYIDWLAKHKPALYVELLKICMREKADEGQQSLTFVVQQVVMAQTPVAGVTNSPILQHIAGPSAPVNTGEVIDG